MAQSGYTPIQLYYSTTAAAVPVNTNLTSGELAINITDGKLYYKDNGGTVRLLASNATSAPVLSFQTSLSGLTPSTATSGVVTLAGTLGAASGGTGLTTLATGSLTYGAGTSPFSTLAIGTAGQILTVNSGATAPQWSTLSGVAVTTFSAGTTGFTPSSATSGAVTLAGTLATTNGGTGLTSFTSGGVVYASSTSALATGSALTFDGTFLTASRGITVNSSGIATSGFYNGVNISGFDALGWSGSSSLVFGGYRSSQWGEIQFYTGGSEQMRLTSTSLYTASGINVGIGLSNPAYKLDVDKGSNGFVARFKGGTRSGYIYADSDTVYLTTDTSVATAFGLNETSDFLNFYTGNSERMRLNSAGNLGLGVTPSAWMSSYKAIELVGGWAALSSNDGYGTAHLTSNCYATSTTAWAYIAASTYKATRYQMGVDGIHAWFNSPAGTGAGNPITFTQAMTLDASGNLGVGTTSPSTGGRFVVYGKVSYAGQNQVALFYSQASGGSVINFQDTASANGSAVGGTGDNLTFYTSSGGGNLTERARIDSSGNLRVAHSVTYSACDGRLSVLNSSGSTAVPTIAVLNPDASAAFVAFSDTATVYGSITRAASAVLYNTTSDQRLKENIQNADSASSLIDSLQVRQFDWKSDNAHQRYGFVAQELVTVAPEAVYQPNDADAMMAVDYSKLVPMLVKEIQSLRQRVAQLETN